MGKKHKSDLPARCEDTTKKNDQHTTDAPMEMQQIPAAVSVGNVDGEADVDMEEIADPRVAEFMARKTLSFPLAELSLEYPFLRDTFYVRECYADYYGIIMKTFEDPEMLGVTVTGTPGEHASRMSTSFVEQHSSYSHECFLLSYPRRHRQVGVHGVFLPALQA